MLNNFKEGLKPLKKDKRDWSHHLTFGATSTKALPENYSLISTILDQGASYKCTAYSSCAVAESQFGKQFDPEWFYEQEGIVNGEVSETGYDLRTAMKTGCKAGFKPLNGNSPEDYYKEDSFFSVDGTFDTFDNIRMAMFMAQDENRCVEGGVMWKDEWTNAPKGIVEEGVNQVGGHAIKIAGWKTINGIPYLIVQNSYGKSLGDNGLFYFPREVVNKDFGKYGLFCWRYKPTNETIRTISGILDLITKVLNLLSKLYA